MKYGSLSGIICWQNWEFNEAAGTIATIDFTWLETELYQ